MPVGQSMMMDAFGVGGGNKPTYSNQPNNNQMGGFT